MTDSDEPALALGLAYELYDELFKASYPDAKYDLIQDMQDVIDDHLDQREGEGE